MAQEALCEILQLWEGEAWSREIDRAEDRLLKEGELWAKELELREFEKWAAELTSEWERKRARGTEEDEKGQVLPKKHKGVPKVEPSKLASQSQCQLVVTVETAREFRLNSVDEFDKAKADFLQSVKELGVDYRASLNMTFHPLLTSVAGLHSLAQKMGVTVLGQDKHVAVPNDTQLPYAIMGGDRVQPSLQITFQKLPEKKMTMQGNLKQGLIVLKGRRSILEQHIDAFLALCGPVVKVTPCAQSVKRKAFKTLAPAGRSIGDLFLSQQAGA